MAQLNAKKVWWFLAKAPEKCLVEAQTLAMAESALSRKCSFFLGGHLCQSDTGEQCRFEGSNRGWGVASNKAVIEGQAKQSMMSWNVSGWCREGSGMEQMREEHFTEFHRIS